MEFYEIKISTLFKSAPFKRNEGSNGKKCLNNSLLNEENLPCQVVPSFIDWSSNDFCPYSVIYQEVLVYIHNGQLQLSISGDELNPVVFAVNKNLFVQILVTDLCWPSSKSCIILTLLVP
jgi:hypothetical protein